MKCVSDVELNRQLVLLLGGSFVTLILVQVILFLSLGRRLLRALRDVTKQNELARSSALQEYIRLQRDENARLVQDTRAATARMNVMADALWDGINQGRTHAAEDAQS